MFLTSRFLTFPLLQNLICHLYRSCCGWGLRKNTQEFLTASLALEFSLQHTPKKWLPLGWDRLQALLVQKQRAACSSWHVCKAGGDAAGGEDAMQHFVDTFTCRSSRTMRVVQ